MQKYSALLNSEKNVHRGRSNKRLIKVKQSSVRYRMTDKAQKGIRVLSNTTSHLVACTGVLDVDYIASDDT